MSGYRNHKRIKFKLSSLTTGISLDVKDPHHFEPFYGYLPVLPLYNNAIEPPVIKKFQHEWKQIYSIPYCGGD